MIWNLNTVALLVPLLFLLIGLTITVAMDPYISRKHRRGKAASGFSSEPTPKPGQVRIPPNSAMFV